MASFTKGESSAIAVTSSEADVGIRHSAQMQKSADWRSGLAGRVPGRGERLTLRDYAREYPVAPERARVQLPPAATPLVGTRPRPCQEPPVGTEVFLPGGLVELHVGRGIWQTVSA